MATKKRKKTSSGTPKRRLNIDKARQKQKELETRSSSDFHDLRQGMNYFFIMPPYSDDVDVLWHEVQQHGMLVCPRTTAGKKCILCDEIRKRAKRGDQDFVDKHRLRSRAFLNAIRKEDIKDKDPSNVKVLALSPTVFQEVIDYITDEEKDISDVTAAVPICIRRKGEMLKTRYKVRFGEETDISRYITDEVMDGLWDLTAIKGAQPASIKDLRKAIRGAADDDFDDEEEDGFDESDLDDDGDEKGKDEEEDELFEDDGDSDDGDDGDEEEDEFIGDDDEEEPEEDDEDAEMDDLDDLDDLLDEDDEDEEEEPPPPKKKSKKSKPAAKQKKAKRKK